MSKIIQKIIPALCFWGIFILVVFKVPYPNSLTQANLMQIVLFFGTFILALTYTFNILFKNIFYSLFLSLGLIFLLILKALDSLNFVTAVLTITAVSLFISYFKKTKRNPSTSSGLKNLTNVPKIPKLTKWRKHTSSS